MNLPILHELSTCKSILIAGAGGGFDVFQDYPFILNWKSVVSMFILPTFPFRILPD